MSYLFDCCWGCEETLQGSQWCHIQINQQENQWYAKICEAQGEGKSLSFKLFDDKSSQNITRYAWNFTLLWNEHLSSYEAINIFLPSYCTLGLLRTFRSDRQSQVPDGYEPYPWKWDMERQTHWRTCWPLLHSGNFVNLYLFTKSLCRRYDHNYSYMFYVFMCTT